MSCNQLAAVHRDLANDAGSLNYTLSVGVFEGGELWVEDSRAEYKQEVPGSANAVWGSKFSTHKSPLAFDGSLWHATFPFQGRWSQIGYTRTLNPKPPKP